MHIFHKWTKWRIEEYIVTVGNMKNSRQIEVDRQQRECTKCGLTRVRKLGK